MSSDPQAASPPAAWPVLSVAERRILGVMVEKAKTTPDVYPLSVNSLVTGCNQKSNRDPLLNLSDAEVEDVLVGLQRKGLAIKITGGRVIRWRHALYEAWHADKVELAALAELLLRGPQTEGELRGRASRMEAIDDLDALRAVLKPLTERRLVVYLTPPERRGTVLTHGFHAPEELERLRSRLGSEETAEPPPPRAALDKPDELHSEVAALRSAVAELQATVARLTDELKQIQQKLAATDRPAV